MRRHYCAHCGAPYLAERADTRYCSQACRSAAYRVRRAVVVHTVAAELAALREEIARLRAAERAG